VFVAQLSRQTASKNAQSVRDTILWVIGSHAHVQTPDGLVKVKENDNIASWQEIKDFLEGPYFGERDGRRFLISRRSLYRRLEELTKEEYIEHAERRGWLKLIKKGWKREIIPFKLTEKGKKRQSFINSLFAASNQLPVEEPIGVFVSLGPKIKDQTSYINVVVRIADLDLVRIIETAILEKQAPQEDYKKLGWLLSLVILLHFKGFYSLIPSLISEEETISELVKKIPIYKKWLQNE
jgi:hypothetical protein